MSASAGYTFPPDITQAILFYLPAKVLGRFKSVSKAWESLISDPYFIKTHTRYHKTTKFILRSVGRSVYSLDASDDWHATGKEGIFPLHPLIKWKRFLGSCNGLVLAVDVNNILFLMNPTLKELWTVPLNSLELPVENNASRLVISGFGYVPCIDDYKIVSILLNGISGRSYKVIFVGVYSLRDNAWKKLRNAPYDHYCSYVSVGALVNNNLHWVTSTRSGCSTILVFSLENEDFDEIQVPDSAEKDKVYSYKPLVFRGKLAIFCRKYHNGCLWVMEEYGVGKSWTKVCCFNGVDRVDREFVTPLCSVEGSDRDIVLRDCRGNTRVFVYNIDEKSYSSRKVREFGDKRRFIVEGTYVESLQSPAKYIRTTP